MSHLIIHKWAFQEQQARQIYRSSFYMAAIKEKETTPPNSGGKKVVLSRLCLCARDVCVGEILTLDNASMKSKACAKRVSIWETRSCVMWSHHDVPVQERHCQIGGSSLSHRFVLNYAICALRAGTAVCSNANTTITCRIAFNLQGIILSFTGNIHSCIVFNFFSQDLKIIAPFQWRSGFSKSDFVYLFVFETARWCTNKSNHRA